MIKPNLITMVHNADHAQKTIELATAFLWQRFANATDEGMIYDMCKEAREAGLYGVASEIKKEWEKGKPAYKKEVLELRNEECVMATGFDTMNFKYGS